MAKNRSSKKQLELLLSYMEDHTLFARGQITSLGPSGHDKYKHMWLQLQQHLNEFGPANKSVSEWESCWKRLKLSAKEKKAKYLTALRRTGNEGNVPDLSEFDNRICKIFGSYGIGLSLIPEVGIHSNNFCEQSHVFFNVTEPMCENMRSNSLIQIQINKPQQRMRPTKGQLNFLIAFMERNPEFARDQCDIDISVQQWNQLVADLNCITGEERSIDSWQRCWRDQIKMAKEKKADYLLFKRNQPLSAFENKLLLAIGDTLPNRREKSVAPNTKRTIDDDDQPSTFSANKKSKTEDENNSTVSKEVIELLKKLSEEIARSFETQNTILLKGFKKINNNVVTMSNNIMLLFQQSQCTNENGEANTMEVPNGTVADIFNADEQYNNEENSYSQFLNNPNDDAEDYLGERNIE